MIYLSFKEFVNKYKLKSEATSNFKIGQILSELKISAKVYMRVDKFNTSIGIVNLHATKGTHWVFLLWKLLVERTPNGL